MKEVQYQVVVIGGGAAGLGTMISLLKNKVKALLLEKNEELGGILNQCIHPGFGLKLYEEELTGPEFAARLINDFLAFKPTYRLGSTVLNIDKNKHQLLYRNAYEGEVLVKFQAVVLATGALERSPGAIALDGVRLPGIMTAGEAQLFLNRYGLLPGKRVFILGSGDIGLIMARRLSLEGAKVLGVAELKPYCNGLRRNVQQCLIDYEIPLYLKTTVVKTYGEKRLEALEIAEVDEKGREIGERKRIECDCLILSIGLLPNIKLYKGLGISLSNAKGNEVDEHLSTEIPGFFACGNALQVHDLVDNVVLEGFKCGEEVVSFLNYDSSLKDEPLKVTIGKGLAYVLPSFLSLPLPTEINFSFRVIHPFQKASLLLYDEMDNLIFKRHYPYLLPSEMLNVRLKSALIEGKRALRYEVKEDE